MKPILFSHCALSAEHKPAGARDYSGKNAFLRSIAKALLAFSSVLLLTGCSRSMTDYGYASYNGTQLALSEPTTSPMKDATGGQNYFIPKDDRLLQYHDYSFVPDPKLNGIELYQNGSIYVYPRKELFYDLHLFQVKVGVNYDKTKAGCPKFYIGFVPVENEYAKTHKVDWTCEKMSTGKDAPSLRKKGNTWIFSEVMKLIPSPNVMKEGKELYCLYTIKFNPDSRYKCAEEFKMQVRKKQQTNNATAQNK